MEKETEKNGNDVVLVSRWLQLQNDFDSTPFDYHSTASRCRTTGVSQSNGSRI